MQTAKTSKTKSKSLTASNCTFHKKQKSELVLTFARNATLISWSITLQSMLSCDRDNKDVVM